MRAADHTAAGSVPRNRRAGLSLRIGTARHDQVLSEHLSAPWSPVEPRVFGANERFLRAAVLERAVVDARFGDETAVHWIYGLSPSPPTFSCEDICDILGVSVDAVRAVVPSPRPRRSDDARETFGRHLACRPDRG